MALLKGNEPLQVLDTLLKQALGGDKGAIAQLCVLGGTAGMLNGLISRDRGSKQTMDGKRTVRQVPFRARPYRIVEQLAGTAGGLKTLHSMAVSHVTGKPAKRFYSIDDAEMGTADGDAVYDKAGAHANLEMEWDVVVTADPVRAAEAISAAGARTHGTSSQKPEQVRLREKLRSGADSVADAVARLTELAQTLGVDVFGSYDMVNLIKNQLQDARDALNANGPKLQPILDDDEDEDDE
ncbi:hypothetical protein [Micromonospora sp. LOL_021]|uniref:hypothetical protein n=1 Tax=Micromonospora sp. LOL_021 TaxID=3345417 RepID=UPI003A83C02A